VVHARLKEVAMPSSSVGTGTWVGPLTMVAVVVISYLMTGDLLGALVGCVAALLVFAFLVLVMRTRAKRGDRNP
jgi:hypothetical protein